MTDETLKVLIGDLWNESNFGDFQMMTGRGGAKNFVKEFCKSQGLEYNLTNFIKTYKGLRKSGMIRTFTYSADA